MKPDNTNQYKEEIREWLSTPDHDFDEGYNLFVRFSHNRALALQLARKRTMSKLEYELGKIIVRTVVIERPVAKMAPIRKAMAKMQPKQVGKLVPTKPVDEFEKKLLKNGKTLAAAEDKLDPDKLPEELKVLWDENRDRYKRMRQLHEQMKQASTDDERAQRRKDLVYHDDKISDNWKVIDAWLKTGKVETGNEPPKDPKPVKDPIGTAKTYVSRNLKKAIEETDPGEKRKLVAKLKQRVDILVKAKHEFKGETLKKLQQLKLVK